jgi:hypothetical protein
MKFERKPIEVTPTCAMCGKSVKEHTAEQMKSCSQERRKSQIEKKIYDPDELSLEKKDILDFCDKVLLRWQKDPLTPEMTKNITAMMAVKTAVYFTDEDSLKAIWSEIIKWVYQLLYENAMTQGQTEKSEWAQTMGKLEKKQN